ILPSGVADGFEMVCREGKITEIRSADADRSTAHKIDLGGNYLGPGFVDLHLHGAKGRDTMEASADAFGAICDYHASGGTTSLLLTTATAPWSEILHVLEVARNLRGDFKQLAGIHLEGPFLSRQRAGAQRAEFICDPDEQKIAQLLEFSEVVKRVTLAPELPGALDAIEQLTSAGIAVSAGHSDAWDEEAQAAFGRGLRHTTHTFNCMSSARRRGASRVAGLLEFALSEPEIVCELIADGHHVSATLMRMLYRAKGTAGICLVTDATAGAGLPENAHFTLAGRECVARQGACWLADGSALAGSAARMIDLVRIAVREIGVPLPEAIGMATANPARAAGLAGKGKLEVGCDADFVVLSPALEVLQTFVGQEKIFSAAT
ncbi:MAG: N-acetylglucosamine-6-phosphate deacetylase, partial [Chthoniobacterales bacterium]